ncbi:NAD-dependent epimerase/dehydratase family protein [Saccharococcus caldoxylosilyticus]|uniref:Putative UDP-galactose 4-epimerase n=1 Tax=Parageobacillus caldoxylosilyticus NBRC 107762 TaxID=1220594 RepID=A0A023DBK7_9BACL|nr:NAD(P)-dependent oxidoreductase [Parageobacillus caldoxylosilyticus]MBB3851067.1 UDP-glucose 4-epimerase [Parageobacillus caldoxylosilyticus]GAJ38346.1 putative UDP-galactose 4-epimerase [Parageobacillus caldoxylosilyticus NBRC 107762]
MKVAVTGGTGFLGKEVISLLHQDQIYTPVILGRNSVADNVSCEYRKTDYSIASLTNVLRDIDAVIHLAAIRGTNGSIADFYPNIIMTENLYESCRKLGIKNIVFASSISVYSDTTKIPWDEEQLPSPKTLYGISKITCEYIGNLYHRQYGLNIKSLRIAQVLGEGEKKGYMMNTFLDRAFEKKTLKVIGKSIAKREFVYVKDVARAILLALHKPDLHGVYNIGSGEAYTNLEIAKMVNNCFDNEDNLIYEDSLDEGIESSLMDSSKAKKELGYIPSFSFKDALNDIKKIKLQNFKS